MIGSYRSFRVRCSIHTCPARASCTRAAVAARPRRRRTAPTARNTASPTSSLTIGGVAHSAGVMQLATGSVHAAPGTGDPTPLAALDERPPATGPPLLERGSDDVAPKPAARAPVAMPELTVSAAMAAFAPPRPLSAGTKRQRRDPRFEAAAVDAAARVSPAARVKYAPHTGIAYARPRDPTDPTTALAPPTKRARRAGALSALAAARAAHRGSAAVDGGAQSASHGSAAWEKQLSGARMEGTVTAVDAHGSDSMAEDMLAITILSRTARSMTTGAEYPVMRVVKVLQGYAAADTRSGAVGGNGSGDATDVVEVHGYAPEVVPCAFPGIPNLVVVRKRTIVAGLDASLPERYSIELLSTALMLATDDALLRSRVMLAVHAHSADSVTGAELRTLWNDTTSGGAKLGLPWLVARVAWPRDAFRLLRWGASHVSIANCLAEGVRAEHSLASYIGRLDDVYAPSCAAGREEGTAGPDVDSPDSGDSGTHARSGIVDAGAGAGVGMGRMSLIAAGFGPVPVGHESTTAICITYKAALRIAKFHEAAGITEVPLTQVALDVAEDIMHLNYSLRVRLEFIDISRQRGLHTPARDLLRILRDEHRVVVSASREAPYQIAPLVLIAAAQRAAPTLLRKNTYFARVGRGLAPASDELPALHALINEEIHTRRQVLIVVSRTELLGRAAAELCPNMHRGVELVASATVREHCPMFHTRFGLIVVGYAETWSTSDFAALFAHWPQSCGPECGTGGVCVCGRCRRVIVCYDPHTPALNCVKSGPTVALAISQRHDATLRNIRRLLAPSGATLRIGGAASNGVIGGPGRSYAALTAACNLLRHGTSLSTLLDTLHAMLANIPEAAQRETIAAMRRNAVERVVPVWCMDAATRDRIMWGSTESDTWPHALPVGSVVTYTKMQQARLCYVRDNVDNETTASGGRAPGGGGGCAPPPGSVTCSDGRVIRPVTKPASKQASGPTRGIMLREYDNTTFCTTTTMLHGSTLRRADAMLIADSPLSRTMFPESIVILSQGMSRQALLSVMCITRERITIIGSAEMLIEVLERSEPEVDCALRTVLAAKGE